MSKIAIIGIAGESVFLSVDGFGKTGETTVAHDFYSELGGKGFNQAVAAARCGAEVCFLGACYRGDKESFTKTARAVGVKGYFVGKKERSPYAVITTDQNGDNRVLVYRGAELTVADLDGFQKEIQTADILLINNEVPVSVNERAVKLAKERGVKVILNPAPARRYDKEFLDQIDLFTPNEHETEGLEGYPNAVVTLGKKGCLIKDTGTLIPAKKGAPAVDTTGAGDTFSGVLATFLAEGKDLKSSCETANIAAGIKVTRKYILNSIPTREEIENFKE